MKRFYRMINRSNALRFIKVVFLLILLDVDKEPIVGSFVAGVGFVIYRFKVSFAHVYQSKAFKTQKDQEEYGSITPSYSF
jgi:outer membrane protein LpxR